MNLLAISTRSSGRGAVILSTRLPGERRDDTWRDRAIGDSSAWRSGPGFRRSTLSPQRDVALPGSPPNGGCGALRFECSPSCNDGACRVHHDRTLDVRSLLPTDLTQFGSAAGSRDFPV